MISKSLFLFMRLNIHNLGSVKTNPMQGLFWDICGVLPFALIQVAFSPACFVSLPLFHIWGKYNMHFMHCFLFFFSVGFLHRCPGGGLWLCWHGDFLAPEESASSPIATFMASVPSNYFNNNWHCVLDSVIVCSFVEKGYYFVHQNCAPF